jgi:LysR family glycine cleavage system transcriptional activator
MSDPLATIPLSAIRVFEAAARVKSFTRAADELGVTQAAVSWQVKALERRLGQPLFRRLPREVVLTEAGERLARAAAEAMKLLRTAVSDLTDQADGVLAVTAPQSLATKWLAPRIGGFQLEHPRIAVRLDTSNHLVDLDREGFDLAIRSGSGAWTGLESVYLFSTGRTPLCTPRVLAELGGLARPEALLTAPLIGLDEDWAEWFTAAGVTTPLAKRRGRLVADQQQIEVASAMAGQGVALGSPILFAAEIDQGALVRPFETMADESAGFWLAWTEGRRRVPRIAAFRDWLAASIARDQAKGLRESSPGAG